ncbi:MAG TPA: BLUF domain-containing protein [Methyloversatilis sp.]
MSETPDLQAVVYVSTASRLMAVPQLESLQIESGDLNLESGVTGVLLYSDGVFMQHFEGTAAAMQATYERIRGSRRHKGIVELLNERVARRSFPDWQMGFAQPAHSELLAMSTARWRRVVSEVQDSSALPLGLMLLQGFWKSARR